MYRNEMFENRGAQLHYSHRPHSGAPALLGLHGFGDTGGTFRFLAPLLEDTFELYYMDWRGHGRSSPLREGYYNASLLFGDLTAFTGQVMPDRYFLMGHSMGAAAAARFAGLFPEEIQGLILFEGFSGIAPIQTELERMRTWARGLRRTKPGRVRVMKNIDMVRQTLSMMHPRLNREQVEYFADEWTRPGPEGKGFVWHMDGDMRTNFSPLPFPWYLSRELWAAVECPVLLFFGKETSLRPGISPGRAYADNAGDAKIEPDEEEALAEIMSHFKDIELHDLPDCGHNIHHDQPDEVMQIMRDWWERKELV